MLMELFILVCEVILAIVGPLECLLLIIYAILKAIFRQKKASIKPANYLREDEISFAIVCRASAVYWLLWSFQTAPNPSPFPYLGIRCKW